jgi:hypothetical protein
MGVLRPRIFVAETVLGALSPAELRALLAHERAHLTAGDNLRRLLLRACAPLPWPAQARRLERRWQEASEGAADVRANAGLDLALALVATARLAPPGARLELGAAAFHSGGAVARRVRRLCVASGEAPPREGSVLAKSLAAGLGIVLGAAAAWPQLASPAHGLLEALVHLP